MNNNHFDDDLDDLINDLNQIVDKPTITYNAPKIQTTTQNKRKCIDPEIGNQQSYKICNNLRCLKCDLQVKCYINKKWNPDVTYLILRNYFSNSTMLNKYQTDDQNSNAYNCQCTNVSAFETQSVPKNWVCSGHTN